MKKKILYIAAIIICLSIITSGTLAYFTTEDTARNVITAGGIEVRVIEQQLVNGTLQAYPSQPIPVMPASVVSKVVSVRSEQQAAWIRAKYTLTVRNSAGQIMEIPAEELETVILISPDTKNWSEKDGWWYYKNPLESGETSKPLFEEVTFSGPKMDNKYQQCTVTVDIITQAVQKSNNGETVWEAKGWPEN